MPSLHYDGPRWTLVVNPSSGRGRAGKLLPQVCADILTKRHDVHLQVHRSTSYDDARLRCIHAVEQARVGDALLVMGGDGMAHLGLNACALTSTPLGVIPAGTGNDFCRSAGLPTSVSGAIAALVSGRTSQIDLAEVQGRLAGGAERRFVGCVVSTGYDARVNNRANHMPTRLGALAYGYAALAELAAFEPVQYRLRLDDRELEFPGMIVAIANGGVFGGGMRIAPDASVTDGLLELTIVHPVSRATLLRLLPQMYSGRFVRDPAVERLQARSVVIDGVGLTGMADGEFLGEVPLTVTARARALTLLGRE